LDAGAGELGDQKGQGGKGKDYGIDDEESASV
jgi:hypothetical protein